MLWSRVPFQPVRPSDREIEAYLGRQASARLTYALAGATEAALPPEGFSINQAQARLGVGEACFVRGVEALRGWRQFEVGWARLCWPRVEVRPGAVVGVLATHLGLWSLSACRVVHLIDEDGPRRRRHGYAYGTLPGHVMRGEERFQVVHDLESDEVRYELYAFSRPAGLLIGALEPYIRVLQRRFTRDSGHAMRRACAGC